MGLKFSQLQTAYVWILTARLYARHILVLYTILVYIYSMLGNVVLKWYGEWKFDEMAHENWTLNTVYIFANLIYMLDSAFYHQWTFGITSHVPVNEFMNIGNVRTTWSEWRITTSMRRDHVYLRTPLWSHSTAHCCFAIHYSSAINCELW